MKGSYCVLQEEQQAGKEQLPSKIILIVEGDDSTGMMLVQVIREETSYCPLLASDSFAALKAIGHFKPSLFILDEWLPRMNGLELCERLHGMKDLQDIPVLLISTALSNEELEKRRIVSISKPLNLDKLLDTVEQLLA